MRVLAIANFPVEAAATRFRVGQFVEPLREQGIELAMRPFLSSPQFAEIYSGGSNLRKATGVVHSVMRRFSDVINARGYDALFVQREAMFFGPAIFEWMIQRAGGLPMILDLDDATYIPYESPTYGKIGSSLKFFGKTDRLIERATSVTCGNRFIAEYVESKGTRAFVVPTVVDLDEFRPRAATPKGVTLTLGWIGTHSTFPSLEWLFPVFERLAREHHFVLRIVGSGRERIEIPGLEVENLPWSLEREVEDFRSIDIGLYPIVPSASASEEWIKGKSGFKAVQYMAVGVPFVMSPVGVASEMGIRDASHLCAESLEDWYNALNRLISDPTLRRKMGGEGRNFALKHYSVESQAEKLADVFRSAVKR